MPKPSMSQGDAARVLLEAIEDVAAIAQDAAEVQRRAHVLVEGQRRLYTAITGQPAPEFQMTARIERAG